MSSSTKMADIQKPWRKILYEDQGVPDNYVDDSFLDEMKKNLYTRTYDFWTVVRESGVVTQQLSSICAFVMSYVYMNDQIMSAQTLFTITSVATVIGYVVNDIVNRRYGMQDVGRTRWADLKTTLIFLAFGFGLSPVLMTLTKTISTDTIYAMTCFMLLANLLFHDYGTDAAVVSQSLSLNAGIFASVCLASRLPTTWHAFATVTFAVEVFALWPVLRRKLKNNVHGAHVFLTVATGVGVCVVMATVTGVGAVMFVFAHLFISFVCPAWLLHLQPYKNNIYGPWDEATIKL